MYGLSPIEHILKNIYFSLQFLIQSSDLRNANINPMHNFMREKWLTLGFVSNF
jgi:hypothetical protein